MRKNYILITALCAFAFFSCSQNHQPAEQRLANARMLLNENEFANAKLEIDSVNILYPKSFDQRKAGVLLLDSIRKAENLFVVDRVNRELAELEPVVETLKKDFIFQKDAKYQEFGIYIPKGISTSGVLSYTTMNAGVEESGRIYLESVYLGAQKHNKIQASSGSEMAETLVIEGDGYIRRFNDLGKNYETITIAGEYENGVAQFISNNANKAVKISLQGSGSSSYTLPNNVKQAIKKACHLSTQMLLVDSLKTEKEKAEFKIFYLENGKQVEVTVE